jgi:hypothetical protein
LNAILAQNIPLVLLSGGEGKEEAVLGQHRFLHMKISRVHPEEEGKDDQNVLGRFYSRY